jgi:hypothetical protein
MREEKETMKEERSLVEGKPRLFSSSSIVHRFFFFPSPAARAFFRAGHLP